MITNNEDFNKPRKTRLEILEERLNKANQTIIQLQVEMKNEDVKEIERLERIFNEMKEIKISIQKQIQEEQIIFDKHLNELKNNSLIEINNEKIRVFKEIEDKNIKLQEKIDYTKKLEEEIRNYKLKIEQLTTQNNKLLETNSNQEEKIQILKSKAFGYDIAKKFEVYKNKETVKNPSNKRNLTEDPKIAYDFWEKENLYIKNPIKLNDLAKEKQLWIGNPSNNIEKLKIENSNSSYYYQYKANFSNNSLTSNMRKVSPLVLNKFANIN